MAMQLSQKRAPDPLPVIPDRLYFKIGDVARLCGVEPYVLRFWETQFPQLRPNKSGSGQRLYRRRDVELVLKIRQLVHGEGYTLAGARQVLAKGHAHPLPTPYRDPQSRLPLIPSDSTPSLEEVSAILAHARTELREIAGLLASPEPRSRGRRARLATMPSTSDTLFPYS
ncbi:MAG: MerR family transcriptional regulator [Terracidiphilus sp.]